MTETAMTEEPGGELGSILGFLTLRLWLAVRAIMTGIEKFAGSKASDVAVTIDGAVNDYGLTASESDKVYSFANYHGVPESLYNKFLAEPLIPDAALKVYDLALGPLLILLGLTLLLGIATRISLFAMGVLYVSLTVGLILLKQDPGIAWLGIHIIMIAMALFYVRHNRFGLMKKF